MRTNRTVIVAVVAMLCSVLVVSSPGVSSPVQAQTPGLAVAKSAPGEVLAGDPITYTLTASNNSPTDALFNLSFRDVLPLGVTYAGPTVPSSAGEPQIISNAAVEPVSGATVQQQTLVWSNVADIQALDTLAITFAVDVNSVGDPARTDVHVIGATLANTADSYASSDPRQVPTFDAAGVPIPNAAVEVATSTTASTTLTAIQLTKTSDSAPEGELLRGIHDHVATYTLEVDVTTLGDTDAITVIDLIPAAMEFLGCGAEDNGTGGPEYPGAPLLSATPAVAGCVDPIRVETVSNPVLGGATYPGVYTLVEWPLGDRSAGTTISLPYAAGIPLFANAPFPVGSVPALDGPQGSNLDNNTGASTREGTSEQSVTNVARGDGNFADAGLLEPGVPSMVGDEDTLTRTIEDIRIRKEIASPANGVFLSGAEADYRIIVETSEYMDAADIVLTDTVPNGLCPIPQSGLTYTGTAPTESVCLGPASPPPSPEFDSVTSDPNGGYVVVFDAIPALPANGTFVATYSAFMRGTYQSGALDGQPTVSGDTFTNTIESSGATTGISDIQPPNTTFPANVWGPLPGVEDGSSATLDTSVLTLDKQLLPRNVSPRLNASSPPVDRCPEPTGQYIEADATPTAADVETLGFRLGDQICFVLRVDFDDTMRTRNAVVADFVPLGTEFLAGTIRATGDNTAPFAVVDSPAAGPIVIEVGSPGVDGNYVNVGGVFEIVFAVEVTQVPAADTAVLAGNLMKMRTENSPGQAQSYRDAANFGIIPPPPIGVIKGVESVDAPVSGPNPANSDVDGSEVQQGSLATFRIDLTNLGVPESFTNYSARELEVLDVLPAQVDCSAITNIVNFGPVTNVGECLDPTEQSTDTNFTNGFAVSVIRWAFDSSDEYALYAADAVSPPASLGTRSLLYTMEIPTPTGVSTRFDNDAGVRSYGGFTNLQGVTSPEYVPADNIDPSLNGLANAPAADDDSWVITPAPEVSKFVTTWIQETQNNTSNPAPPVATRPLPVIGGNGQAVVGEYVTYRYLVDVPSQTTVFGAELTDRPPNPSGTIVFETSPPAPVPVPALVYYPDASSTATAPPPAGITFDPATGTVDFGAEYRNTTASDQRFEVVISARVTGASLNQTQQPTRTNTASFASTDATGAPLPAVSDTAQVQIRQPQPTVTKAASGQVNGFVVGGQTVTYTLTASTPGGRPPLHDAWIEDCVPVGLQNVTLVAPSAPSIGPLVGPAAEAEGCAPGETYIAFGLGTVAPGNGGVATRQYTAVVSTSSVGGQQYRNTATLTGSSLDDGNTVPGDDNPIERVYSDTDTETITVAGVAALKTVDPGVARIGERVDFTVRLVVPQNTNFYQAAILDRLPTGLTDPVFVSSSCTNVSDNSPCALVATALGPVVDPGGGANLYALYFGDVLSAPSARVVTITYSVRVDDIASNNDGVDLTNTAQARWDTVDRPDTDVTTPLYPWENSGVANSATVTVIEPDVTVAKLASDDTPQPGEVFTYTLTIRNNGTSEAYNVVVTDTLPTGVELVPSASSPSDLGTYVPGTRTITWTNPAVVIDPGDAITVTYDARLAPSTTIGDSTPVVDFTNTASVTNFESLPTGGRVDVGNTTTEIVDPQFPDLAVDKTVTTPEPVYIGQEVTWRVQVTNNGGGTAFAVDVRDTLPADWAYVAGSTTIVRPSGTLTTDPSTIGGGLIPQRLTWLDLGSLLTGESIVVTFRAVAAPSVVDPPPDPFPGGSFRQVNSADASAVDNSGATENIDGPYTDSDDASTRIDAADVQIVKTNAAAPPVAGANYTWSVVVSNNGPDTAVGPFTVVDTLPTLAPDPLTFVSATGTGWTCSQAAGVVTCNRTNPANTLASGASFPPIAVTVRTPSEFLGDITNTASVSDRTYDPDLANNSSTVTATVVDQADLRILKSRTDPLIVAGRTVTYLLDITNLGPSTSRETITVTDTLPGGTTFVSAPTAGAGDPWDCAEAAGVVSCTLLEGTTRAPVGDLLAGSAAPQIAITVLVDPGAPPGVDITNSATVIAGSTTDPIPGNNTDTDVGAPTASADLAIDKRSTGALVAGQPATYLLRVDNLGPSDAASPVIADALPTGLTYSGFTSVRQPGAGAGSWSCSSSAPDTAFSCTLSGRLAAGDHAIVEIDVDVAPDVLGTIVNTATVSSTTPDPVLDNNTDDDVSPFDTFADLAIVKTGPSVPVAAGTSFQWTLAVTNNGPSVSRQPITVIDGLPTGVEYLGYNTGAGWTCFDAPATAPGFSTVVTCTQATDIGFPAPGNAAPPIVLDVRVLPDAGPALLENTAEVRGTTNDPNLANNVDEHTVVVVDDADLQIVKTPATQDVRAGENATFTLQVTNNGPSTADNVVVTDDLPSGMTTVPFNASPWVCVTPTAVTISCELATLPPGAAPPITFQAAIGAGVPDGSTLTNTTSVDSTTPDRDPGNNDDSANVVVSAEADLTISKTHPAGPVIAGTDMEFQITVENLGPSDALADVVVVDTLPNGFSYVGVSGSWDCVPGSANPQIVTCTYLSGALLAGTVADPLLMLVGIAADLPDGTYSNTASVSSPTTDPDLDNNQTQDDVVLGTVADVSIVKAHDPDLVMVGEQLEFTLSVRNDGPSDAQNVVVTDAIPAGLDFVSAAGQLSPSSWDCSLSVAPLVNCVLAGPLPAAATAEQIVVTVTVLADAYPSVENVAQVATDTTDLDPSNNRSTDTVVVPPLVDLVIDKTHADPVAVGGLITYTVTVTNQGPTADPGPVTISDDLPDSLTPVSASGPGVTCAILLQLVSCSADNTLEVGGSLTVTIVADVLATAYPSVTNTAVVGTPSTETDLTNNRATDVATVEPLIGLALVKTLGGTNAGVANWVLSVTNLGPNATVEPIVVVDQLPVGLAYVSASGFGWICSESAGRVECSYAEVLEAGATAPPISLVTNITAPAGTTVVNTATASGGGPEVPSVTDGAELTVPALPSTSLPTTGGSNGGIVQLAMMLGLLGLVLLAMSKLRRRFPAV